MKYTATEYDMGTRTLDVYFSGCSLRCPGCHNEELWDSEGNQKDLTELVSSLSSPLVTTVRIMGGEPTEQEGLLDFLKVLKSLGLSVWLFTGFPSIATKYLPYVDYIKLGAYEEGLEGWETPFGFPLASTNQMIFEVGTNEVHTYTGTYANAYYIPGEYDKLYRDTQLYIQGEINNG